MTRDGDRWQVVRGVLAETARTVARRDLALASAGAALYGALAVVPSLLVAIALAQVPLGRERVAEYGRMVAANLPSGLGAGRGVVELLGAGLSLSPLALAFAVVMGSAYGDGLSRALLRLAPPERRERPPAWWSRAAVLPLLGMAPLLLAGLLLLTPLVSRGRQDSALGLAWSVYLSLNIVWVITWLPLTWTYRVVGPGRPAWRAALIGGVVTGAFASGFIQGFLLFLALPIDLDRPFGGLPGVGIVSALLLWVWLLHAVVCVGYAFTWAVDGALRAHGRATTTAG